jgi:outer membrane receptor protein involved in Fe transport
MKTPAPAQISFRSPARDAATRLVPVISASVIVGALIFARPMLAQSAVTRPSPVTEKTAAKTADETVVLTPFQVVSDDRGYQAFNTLSGTRLNSKLEDLGSSITVVTKQQLIDTAAVDINDVFLYEANTEGTGNFTQFNTNRTGGVQDNVSADPQTANRIRGIGGSGASGTGTNTNSTFGANTAIGNFSSNAKIPLDLYNIDSVEINRGPNSSLFGIGNSAGSVNLVPTQANLTRTISGFTFRLDSFGGHRESLDLNRPLVANKLALRVAAVNESKGFTRKPSSERIRRGQISFLARPFPNTTVNGSAERYTNFARRPNSLTPRDAISEWLSTGKPSWDPTTQTVTRQGVRTGPFPVAQDANLPAGLMSGATNLTGRLSAWIEDSRVKFFTQNAIGNPITTGTPTPFTQNSAVRYLESGNFLIRNKGGLFPLYIAPAIRNKSVYDWSSINATAANYSIDTANTYRLEAEHYFLKTPQHILAARAGWFRQEFSRTQNQFLDNTDSVLYVDVNEKLLDGRPNPYFQRPYIQAVTPLRGITPEIGDTQNADLAYQFTPKDAPRWLAWIGQQRLGLHGETRRSDTTNFRDAATVSNPTGWAAVTLQGVGVTRASLQRYYVGDAQGTNFDTGPSPINGITGQHALAWFNNRTGQWVNEDITVADLPITGTSSNRVEIRTLSATLQSYFMNDRIVATYGFRRDRQRTRQSNGIAFDPAAGRITNAALKIWNPWVEQSGDTKTFGVVTKPTRWLNVFYNHSDSFAPAPSLQTLFGDPLPNPKGTGKDYGISFTALDNKLSVKINRYEATDLNSRGNEAGTIGQRTLRMEGRLNNGTNFGFALRPWAENLARSRFARQGITSPSSTQVLTATAAIMGMPESWLSRLGDNITGLSTDGLTDVTSRGYEIEITYNPTRNWRIKFNVAQQQAIDSNISPDTVQFWNARLPVWTTLRDDNGQLWWTSVATTNLSGTVNNARDYYLTQLLAPYQLAVANQGKPRSQVREWRSNALTNYTFSEGKLKDFGVGGAIRWQDKAAIGFLGAAPESDGVVRSLDAGKPVFDRARFAVDLSASYGFRLFRDRVRAKVQLNVRDVLENGRLQKVAINPDGSTYAFRIIDPRQIILSTSFDL